ncbi:putative DNA helicase [Dioscorea sansibarensis]
MSILRTTPRGCDNSFQRASKPPLPVDKEEKKKVIGYVEKVSTIRNCSSISATSGIFAAKISDTFTRFLNSLWMMFLISYMHIL